MALVSVEAHAVLQPRLPGAQLVPSLQHLALHEAVQVDRGACSDLRVVPVPPLVVSIHIAHTHSNLHSIVSMIMELITVQGDETVRNSVKAASRMNGISRFGHASKS